MERQGLIPPNKMNMMNNVVDGITKGIVGDKRPVKAKPEECGPTWIKTKSGRFVRVKHK